MAKKNSIVIQDEWLDLSSLALPSGTTVEEVEKILVVKPIKLSLEVVLPKTTDDFDFDYQKNGELKKFRANLESKVADALGSIADEDQPADGKKTLDNINGYVEKLIKSFRPLLRATIAKAIGDGCKPDDLLTAGSMRFDKIEFQIGFGDQDEEQLALLDMTKAIKRTKKLQQCGIAWKGCEVVVSVRLRKPFKQAELKELRELLPDGFSRGAHMQAGQFLAMAKGDLELNFPDKSKLPLAAFLRKALSRQVGQQVHLTLGTMEDEDEETSKSKKEIK